MTPYVNGVSPALDGEFPQPGSPRMGVSDATQGATS